MKKILILLLLIAFSAMSVFPVNSEVVTAKTKAKSYLMDKSKKYTIAKYTTIKGKKSTSKITLHYPKKNNSYSAWHYGKHPYYYENQNKNNYHHSSGAGGAYAVPTKPKKGQKVCVRGSGNPCNTKVYSTNKTVKTKAGTFKNTTVLISNIQYKNAKGKIIKNKYLFYYAPKNGLVKVTQNGVTTEELIKKTNYKK